MIELIIGILIGITITIIIVGLLARRYYTKNFKSVGVDLKQIFGNDFDFNFKDSDFEE